MHFRLYAVLLWASVGATGCNLFGGESADSLAARREADGKAVGGACRHAGRAIEDCYVLNRRAEKAAVYAGWREMNDYMRENKLEPVLPQLTADAAGRSENKAEPAESTGDKGDADKPRTKDSGSVAPERSRKGDS